MAGIKRAQMELMPNLEICAINGVGLETTDLDVARRARRDGHHHAGPSTTTWPTSLWRWRSPPAGASPRRPLRAPWRLARGPHGAGPQAHRHEGRADRLGRIGAEVASRLQGFKCAISYTDPLPRGLSYRRVADPVTSPGRATSSFSAPPVRPGGAAAPTSPGPCSRRSARAASSSHRPRLAGRRARFGRAPGQRRAGCGRARRLRRRAERAAGLLALDMSS